METTVLTIPMIPPSGNKYIRSHWGVKKKLRNNFAWALMIAIRGQDRKFPFPTPLPIRKSLVNRSQFASTPSPLPSSQAIVDVMVYSNAAKSAGGRARRLDRDNLWGGCKPLFDAMKDIGMIVNDSPKWLQADVNEDRTLDLSVKTVIKISYGGSDASR